LKGIQEKKSRSKKDNFRKKDTAKGSTLRKRSGKGPRDSKGGKLSGKVRETVGASIKGGKKGRVRKCIVM